MSTFRINPFLAQKLGQLKDAYQNSLEKNDLNPDEFKVDNFFSAKRFGTNDLDFTFFHNSGMFFNVRLIPSERNTFIFGLGDLNRTKPPDPPPYEMYKSLHVQQNVDHSLKWFKENLDEYLSVVSDLQKDIEIPESITSVKDLKKKIEKLEKEKLETNKRIDQYYEENEQLKEKIEKEKFRKKVWQTIANFQIGYSLFTDTLPEIFRFIFENTQFLDIEKMNELLEIFKMIFAIIL
jgi:hypothetical protein